MLLLKSEDEPDVHMFAKSNKKTSRISDADWYRKLLQDAMLT